MKWVEKGGRTVDEAVEAAIEELGVNRDQVEVEILEEGSRGFLGLIGGKQPRVRVTVVDVRDATDTDVTDVDAVDVTDVRQQKIDAGLGFLKGLLDLIACPASMEFSLISEDTVLIEFSGDNLGLIIGRRGQMLDALQSLVSTVANGRVEGEWLRFVLDAAGYRERREKTLQELALRMAERAKKQRRRRVLEPMNAMERRIIHMALADDDEVENTVKVTTHTTVG